MNILVPYSAILEFLDTDATAQDFQRCLSLSGPSVEKLTKTSDGDYVLDIEITTNRMDAACILGIVQEGVAILPNYGFKAVLKKNLLDLSFADVKFKQAKLLDIKRDPYLNPRFTAVVLENVQIRESEENIKDFLKKVGIRSINNVVDISNYLMVLFGQPVHIFDYEKIKTGKMVLRESIKNESIQTLDGKTYNLPGGDIVIEDGEQRLIDLCGIMGGKLSEVDINTKKIVLFVQNYNKKNIRLTSMLTGARSQASAFFEKGIDSDRVEPTFVYGIKLLKELANAEAASCLIDEYEKPTILNVIKVSENYFLEKIGLKLESSKIKQILNSLGFKISQSKSELAVTVPYFRNNDVLAKEDLFEEVARIYGYQNIPEELPPFTFISDDFIRFHEKISNVSSNIKKLLSGLGFFEVYNYSMISEKENKQFHLPENSIKMLNPMSEDLVVFRQSLVPSLVRNAILNRDKKDLGLFELANVYLPKTNDLPTERKTLSILLKSNFFKLKGVAEAIFEFASLKNVAFLNKANLPDFLDVNQCAEIYLNADSIGFIGTLKKDLLYSLNIREEITVLELSFDSLANAFSENNLNDTDNSASTFIEDLTYISSKNLDWQSLTRSITSKFPAVKKIEFRGTYNNANTMRIYTSSKTGKSIFQSIIDFIEKELHLKIKK